MQHHQNGRYIHFLSMNHSGQFRKRQLMFKVSTDGIIYLVCPSFCSHVFYFLLPFLFSCSSCSCFASCLTGAHSSSEMSERLHLTGSRHTGRRTPQPQREKERRQEKKKAHTTHKQKGNKTNSNSTPDTQERESLLYPSCGDVVSSSFRLVWSAPLSRHIPRRRSNFMRH